MEAVNHLIFELESVRYAIPTEKVLEIIPLPGLTPTVELPPQIRGIFDLRGTFVVVTDAVFMLTGRPHKCSVTDKIIVLTGNGYTPGLLVSDVFDVISIDPGEMAPVSSVFPESGAMSFRYIKGMVSTADGIVFILAVDSLLDAGEIDVEEAFPPQIDAKDDGMAPLPGNDDGYFAPEASDYERDIFRERASAFRGKKEEEEFSEKESYALFTLDGELFGIKTANVSGFHEIRGYTPVPCCPPHIIGQTNFHGTIITLVDISPVVKTSSPGVKDLLKIIIIETGEGKAGIRVDEVNDVVYLLDKDILPLPSASRFDDESLQKGAAYFHGRMLTIIDIEKILLQGGLVVDEEF